MNSASAWNDFNLDLLGAGYDKDVYHELPVDVMEFGRNEALNTFGDGTRFDRLEGYKRLIAGSDAITNDDLRHIFDGDVNKKLVNNPLKLFLRHLGTLYIQRSQEELEKTAKKERVARELREQHSGSRR